MEENRRPGHQLGSRRSGMSAGGKRGAHSGERKRRTPPRDRSLGCHAPQARGPARRPRCRASAHRRVARPLPHTRGSRISDSGRPRTSTPCNPIDSNAAIKPASERAGRGCSRPTGLGARPRSRGHRTRRRRRRTGRDRERAARARWRRPNEHPHRPRRRRGAALGWPIENVSAPPTGWPSAEITRQLSRCVPSDSPEGSVTTMVAPSAAIVPLSSMISPRGTHQPQCQRRYRLVEGEPQLGRRLRHHRPVGRLAADERSMRVRRARIGERGQAAQPGARCCA